MYKYQNINGWCILEDEEDKTMLHTAKKEKITECRWHDGYVDDIIIPYFIKNKRTVIDGGASYGWMATSFAKYFKEVKCFELREDVRYALTQNTKNFNNVEIFNCGLGDKKAKIKYTKSRNTGITKIKREDLQDSESLVTTKEAGPPIESLEKDGAPHSYNGALINTIDSFNFKDVDCIKLDIEHHEYYALLGSIETIKKWKPILIVEISYAKNRPLCQFRPRQRIFKLLRQLNYEIVDVRKNDFIFAPKN